MNFWREGPTMRRIFTTSLFLTSLILTGLLVSTSAYAGDAAGDAAGDVADAGDGVHAADSPETSDLEKQSPSRAEFHAAQDPEVDAAVDAIVEELSAVGTGPRERRVSNPAPGIRLPLLANPGKLPRLGLVNEGAAETLADEAAAARELPGGDEGEDDHAM
jgi:hypothetical protein